MHPNGQAVQSSLERIAHVKTYEVVMDILGLPLDHQRSPLLTLSPTFLPFENDTS